jgi:hypothetical protein
VTGVRDGKPAFARMFERRRGILEPYGRRMHVVADAEGGYGEWADPKTARHGGASNSE